MLGVQTTRESFMMLQAIGDPEADHQHLAQSTDFL
jgi:hypothetical protein